MNATNTNLATNFDIEEQLVSNIFDHMVGIIYEYTNERMWWLSRNEVDQTMPKSFRKHFPKTRVIIDATEIRTQIPKSVRAAVLKYSSYKHYHTIKVLIGIGEYFHRFPNLDTFEILVTFYNVKYLQIICLGTIYNLKPEGCDIVSL